jgi:UDP-GlcNAc:undecaprenyl-phosphate GlcNAc-1-phosphate transferase
MILTLAGSLLPGFGFGLALVAGATPLAKRLAHHLGCVAKPAKDRWHKSPVPLMGGVAVIGVFTVVGLFAGAPTWLVLGALGLCILGLLDDIVALTPRTKLLCEIPFALAAAALVNIPHVMPWGLQNLAVAFWVLTAINAYNLVDGLDGLAAGLGMIGALAVAAIAVLHHDRTLAVTALLFAGVLSGFLIYNFSPASIYLGDAGSLAGGFVLGVLCLDAVRYAGQSKLAILATPALLMAVPIIDTSIVTVTRLATGRAISNRGLDHCHHRLHNLGLSQKRVAFALWALGSVGALWAIFISWASRATIITVLPLCALMFATVGLFLANLSFEHEPPSRLYGVVPRLGSLILSLAYRRRAVEFALDFLVISSAYYGAVLIHHNFQPTWAHVAADSRVLPLVCLGAYTAFLITRTYRQMWRYAGVEAALRFQVAAVLAGLLIASISSLAGLQIPPSRLALFVILLANLLVGTRMSFRILAAVLKHFAAPIRRVLVVGAGSAGESVARNLMRDGVAELSLVGFLDDDVFKHRMLVRGYRVLGGITDLDRVYRETGFNEILIAQDETAAEDLVTLQAFASSHDVAIHRYLARIDTLALTRNGKTTDGQATDGKAVEGKTIDGKAGDGKARDAKAGDGKTIGVAPSPLV